MKKRVVGAVCCAGGLHTQFRGCEKLESEVLWRDDILKPQCIALSEKHSAESHRLFIEVLNDT